MAADLPDNALELRSLVTSHGTLELSLQQVPIPVPSANEVLVRVEASPINPSDLGLLLAGADMTTAHVAGTPERPVITAPLTEDMLRALSARVDRSLPVGNEGAGTVVAAGSSSTAQALLGQNSGDRRAARCMRNTARLTFPRVLFCPRGQRREKGLRPLSIPSLRSEWLKPCGAKVIPASYTRLPRRTLARCSSSSALRTAWRSSTSSASPIKKNF